ncbi:MAG TPA: type II toxin-antitoxin system HicB family antitoxin [Xanthobacteraceae bacterium]|nr:type II toxin-antitoxin system HicB family antitoxin [Xanthobacteraceae bacterium]
MKRQLYPAVLERGPRGTFGAWFPDFPGCVAGGRSQEEAIERAEQALAQAVDGWVEQGRRLPEPTPIERIVPPKGSDVAAFFMVGVNPPDPSERVNVYLPKSLITKIDKRAAELGMSRSSFFGFASSLALEWPGGFPRGAPVGPRSKVHKTGALRAEKRPGKERAR